MSEQPANGHPGPRTRLSRRMHIGLVVVGIVFALIGLGLLLVPSAPQTIGWVAYQPLSETVFLPPASVPTPRNLVGIVVGSCGVLLLAFAAGWAFGRRETVSTSTE